MTRENCLVIVCGTLLAVDPSSGQTRIASTARVDVDVVYHECTNPPPPPRCVSMGEQPVQADCRDCSTWRRIELGSRTVALNVQPGEVQPMNEFVREIAEEGYEAAYPTVDGRPLTTTELYQNASEVGWADVTDASDREGAFAVWEGGSGLVVSDSGGIVEILYPSTALGGELNTAPLDFLASVEDVKFLVPDTEAEPGQM